MSGPQVDARGPVLTVWRCFGHRCPHAQRIREGYARGRFGNVDQATAGCRRVMGSRSHSLRLHRHRSPTARPEGHPSICPPAGNDKSCGSGRPTPSRRFTRTPTKTCLYKSMAASASPCTPRGSASAYTRTPSRGCRTSPRSTPPHPTGDHRPRAGAVHSAILVAPRHRPRTVDQPQLLVVHGPAAGAFTSVGCLVCPPGPVC